MARRMVFLGSKQSGLELLRLTLDTLPMSEVLAVICAADEKDPRSVLSQFERLAHEFDLVLEISANKAQTVEILKRLRPDWALLCGWYQLIDLHALSGIEFYGFHNSCLPAYRGNAPLVWQIMNGETSGGVSFFRLGDGMDEGDLVAQERFPISGEDTISDALRQATALILSIAGKHLRTVHLGSAKLKPQPPTGISYCGLRIPDDGRIDWNWPADRIHNFVRAQTHPYPGAFCLMPSTDSVRIWSSQVEPRRYFAQPGAILEIHEEYVVVGCGDGALQILGASRDSEDTVSPRVLFNSLRMRLK